MPARTGSLPTNRATPRLFVIASLLLVALLAAVSLGLTETAASSRKGSEALSLVAQQGGATPVGATPVVTDYCDSIAPGVGAEPWIRTELYFGTTLPDGSPISAEQWQAFLDEEITPRFPAGLTVLEGYGQFLDSQGVIRAEESIVLIIFYPADAIAESSQGFEEIRDAYETQFDQESVLRVDSEPICVSF